jgi:hypothetical protein
VEGVDLPVVPSAIWPEDIAYQALIEPQEIAVDVSVVGVGHTVNLSRLRAESVG